MTDDPAEQRLMEALWRRKLTAAEEADLAEWLAKHPESREGWKMEAALSGLLAEMTPAPVSSNFTARVLQEIQRDVLAAGSRRGTNAGWRAWLPRLAFGAGLVVAGSSSYHFVRAAHHSRMVDGVAMVSQVASLPSVEILQDFDAIRAMDRAPGADEELLHILQ